MITINEYKKVFEAFSGKTSNSWVYFERRTLESNHQEVLIPRLYAKPGSFVRWIYWLFEGILKRHASLDKDLRCSIENAKRIVDLENPGEEAMLLRVTGVANEILGKLKRANLRDVQLGLTDMPLGEKHSEVALSFDWNQSENLLFDRTYVDDLVRTIEFYNSGRRDWLHPDLSALLRADFPLNALNQFMSFIVPLIEGQREILGKTFSEANAARLRKMILAIMNMLNAKRGGLKDTKQVDSKFKELYSTIVLQIAEALTHCTNGVNAGIEGIFYHLLMPEGGNLGHRVRLTLQTVRDRVFRQAIRNCLLSPPFWNSRGSEYWLSHEAASVNYYYGKMAREFGLPSSVSELDSNYQTFALQGQEDNIRSFFHRNYTSSKIIESISDVIHNPHDPMIPTRLFTEWVTQTYGENRHYLLTDSGQYHSCCIARLLRELKIIV